MSSFQMWLILTAPKLAMAVAVLGVTTIVLWLCAGFFHYMEDRDLEPSPFVSTWKPPILGAIALCIALLVPSPKEAGMIWLAPRLTAAAPAIGEGSRELLDLAKQWLREREGVDGELSDDNSNDR